VATNPISVATFKARFRFFELTDPVVVTMALDEAVATYGGCAAFPQYPGIIGNHAAHLLASEPGGASLRISKTTPDTVYSINRDTLLKQIPASGTVVCP
jgi:hypothetical protein